MSSRSRGRAGTVLALAALALAGAAFVCGRKSAPPGDLPLQRASGGFGLGPAASADWSFHAFDPRIESGCEAELAPIPGGACYVPHHASALLYLELPAGRGPRRSGREP